MSILILILIFILIRIPILSLILILILILIPIPMPIRMIIGTYRYMAPEIFSGEKDYGYPVDVYSSAITVSL